MRFLIYGIFLAGWLSMWIWTYTCHIKKACCPGRIVMEDQLDNRDVDPGVPVAFRISGSEPLTGLQFPLFRDSLIAQLDSGNVLEVTGLFTDLETPEMGADRAVAVLDILAPNLSQHRYSLKSKRRAEIGVASGDEELLIAYEVKILSRVEGKDTLADNQSR